MLYFVMLSTLITNSACLKRVIFQKYHGRHVLFVFYFSFDEMQSLLLYARAQSYVCIFNYALKQIFRLFE